MITVQDLKKYADNSNLRTLAKKLRAEHWQYAELLISQMRDDSELEMNRVWCMIPRSAKPSPDDKLARVIPELISRVITLRKQQQGDSK